MISKLLCYALFQKAIVIVHFFYKCYPNRKDRTPKQIDKILLSEWSICAFITTRIATLKAYVGTYLTFKSFGYIYSYKKYSLCWGCYGNIFSTLDLYNSTWDISLFGFDTYKSGPPWQPRIPRIGPCQVLAATLTLSQPGGADYAHPILGSLAG